jgi:hypothetical protein
LPGTGLPNSFFSFQNVGVARLLLHDDAYGHLLKSVQIEYVLQLKHRQELIQKLTGEKSKTYYNYTLT